MSPEQAAGEEIDTRSDLYALGVVAYEMLAGQPPFQGPHRVVVSRHIAERPVPIERLRPETPRELAGAVMRALEKQPSDRWQTGEEFRQAIAGERATPSSTRHTRRRVISLAAAALLLLVDFRGDALQGCACPPCGQPGRFGGASAGPRGAGLDCQVYVPGLQPPLRGSGLLSPGRL